MLQVRFDGPNWKVQATVTTPISGFKQSRRVMNKKVSLKCLMKTNVIHMKPTFENTV
jgi:hypothetical protein